MALKQKLREDKKKLDDAKARASHKGPMGKSDVCSCVSMSEQGLG